MKLYIKFISLSFLISIAQFSFASNTQSSCFQNDTQSKNYENRLLSEKEQAQITTCLSKNLLSNNDDIINSSLTKIIAAKEVLPAHKHIFTLFKKTKKPNLAFNAVASLIEEPSAILPYQKWLLNLLSSTQTPEYKKILAYILLADIDSAPESLSPILLPALKGQDKVLQNYSAGAYTLIYKMEGDKYLQNFIGLYAPAKTFALRATETAKIDESTLKDSLEDALEGTDTLTKTGAILWASDLRDKDLLETLIFSEDTDILPTEAPILLDNFDITQKYLLKALNQKPETKPATRAVLVFGMKGFDDDNIIELLKNGSKNEQANASRIVLSIANMLRTNPENYLVPEVQKQILRKTIVPLGTLQKHTSNEKVKLYSSAALKEIYKLLNDK